MDYLSIALNLGVPFRLLSTGSEHYLQELIDANLWEPPHHLIRGFTINEANAIIQAFDNRMEENSNSNLSTLWHWVIRFLFWTGCRHGECAALRWRHISSDFRFITFQRSYDRLTKIEKDTKTATTRIFPCGPKLQEFLKDIKPDSVIPSRYVFSNHNRLPINFGTFNTYWIGRGAKNQENFYNKYIRGILPELIEKGVINNYQNPYATRHTYINIQLDAGIKAKDVAVLVGNSAATIAQYYESISREPIQPVEF